MFNRWLLSCRITHLRPVGSRCGFEGVEIGRHMEKEHTLEKNLSVSCKPGNVHSCIAAQWKRRHLLQNGWKITVKNDPIVSLPFLRAVLYPSHLPRSTTLLYPLFGCLPLSMSRRPLSPHLEASFSSLYHSHVSAMQEDQTENLRHFLPHTASCHEFASSDDLFVDLFAWGTSSRYVKQYSVCVLLPLEYSENEKCQFTLEEGS